MKKEKFSRGDVAISLKGRDKNKFFIITDFDPENGIALITDGRIRKTARPKKKNAKHLKKIQSAVCIELAERIYNGEPASDRKVKTAIARSSQKI